jgi:DNA-binding XRE family transcriptional regulator
MTQVWRQRLGAHIRRRRVDAGHSQDSLAATAGLSRETVNKVENGRGDYGIDQALLLLVCAETKEIEDALQLDPVVQIVAAARGINNLSPREIEACRTLLEAMHDPKRKNQAETYIKLLRDGEKPPHLRDVSADR